MHDDVLLISLEESIQQIWTCTTSAIIDHKHEGSLKYLGMTIASRSRGDERILARGVWTSRALDVSRTGTWERALGSESSRASILGAVR